MGRLISGLDFSDLRRRRDDATSRRENYSADFQAWKKPLKKFEADLLNSVPKFIRDYFSGDSSIGVEVDSSDNYVEVDIFGQAYKSSMNWSFRITAKKRASEDTVRISRTQSNSSMGQSFIDTPEKLAEMREMIPVLEWLVDKAEGWINNAYKASTTTLIDSYGFDPSRMPTQPDQFNAVKEARRLRDQQLANFFGSTEDFVYAGKHSSYNGEDAFRIVKQTAKTFTIERQTSYGWEPVPPINLSVPLTDNFKFVPNGPWGLQDVIDFPDFFEIVNGAGITRFEVKNGMLFVRTYQTDVQVKTDAEAKKYLKLRSW